MTAALDIENLTKHFGSTVAVDSLNLEIPAGRLQALLAPALAWTMRQYDRV